MATTTLARQVGQGLQTIAHTAEPRDINQSSGRLTYVEVTGSTREAIVSVLSERIQLMDSALQQFPALRKILADAERPDADVELVREIAELHDLVQLEEDGYQALRAQLMELMIQVNPEDAWLWEPGNLAAFREAKAEVEAGRVKHYDSGEAFLADLEDRAG
ncbi:MAG TPA: hypothetical protein VN837_08665 [Chloroflexota bacterium]|nr:hypothetical protein [Chloroflexota bacterium]